MRAFLGVCHCRVSARAAGLESPLAIDRAAEKPETARSLIVCPTASVIAGGVGFALEAVLTAVATLRVWQSLASLAPDAYAQRAGSADSAVVRLVEIVVTGAQAAGFAPLGLL